MPEEAPPPAAEPSSTAARLFSYAVHGAAGLAGLYYGVDVGFQISGALMAAVMGLNGAVFAWLVTSFILERIFKIKPKA